MLNMFNALADLVTSQAVGYATTKDTFNDMQDVGLWPAYQHIKRVEAITLSYSTNPDSINGIDVTYSLTNSPTLATTIRGTATGQQVTFDLRKNPTQYFVGFFGTQDSGSKPVLRTLGFLVYDTQTGSIFPAGNGAVPSPSTSTLTTGFASVGEIAGFSGTTAANGNLDTLSIYRFQPGTGSSGI